MNEEELNALAIKAASSLTQFFEVGEFKSPCGESKWESANVEDIAEHLKPSLLAAFNSTRKNYGKRI